MYFNEEMYFKQKSNKEMIAAKTLKNIFYIIVMHLLSLLRL